MTNPQTTFVIGGDIDVRRLGFGAMRITGPGTWGPPPDRAAARALLRRAVELGVQLIDTADAYGRPGHLRSACEASLRRLELDRIDLYQLHTPDPAVPFAESIGALKDLQNEGKIRHIGVSNVTLEQLAIARTVADIGTVQHRLDFTNSRWRDMLNECETHEIGFIPYRPLRAWVDAAHRQVLTHAASRLSASTDQIALAWLLAVSPVTLPIPGTATRAHLEDNLAAAAFRLDQDEIHGITAAVSQP